MSGGTGSKGFGLEIDVVGLTKSRQYATALLALHPELWEVYRAQKSERQVRRLKAKVRAVTSGADE